MGMKSMDLRVSELERRVEALEKNGKPAKDKKHEAPPAPELPAKQGAAS